MQKQNNKLDSSIEITINSWNHTTTIGRFKYNEFEIRKSNQGKNNIFQSKYCRAGCIELGK
jgi:hypothetical protein